MDNNPQNLIDSLDYLLGQSSTPSELDFIPIEVQDCLFSAMFYEKYDKLTERNKQGLLEQLESAKVGYDDKNYAKLYAELCYALLYANLNMQMAEDYASMALQLTDPRGH